MSKIKLNTFSYNFAHVALLLLDTESDMDDNSRGSAIII